MLLRKGVWSAIPSMPPERKKQVKQTNVKKCRLFCGFSIDRIVARVFLFLLLFILWFLPACLFRLLAAALLCVPSSIVYTIIPRHSRFTSPFFPTRKTHINTHILTSSPCSFLICFSYSLSSSHARKRGRERRDEEEGKE